MKKIISLGLVLVGLNAAGQDLRSICENAYYATGYTKLHSYKVTIDWARISDHALVKLENIVYGDMFKVLKETDYARKTVYELKEAGSFSHEQYVKALEDLSILSGKNINCLYDL
ncbi:hypothetical protein [Bacteriovorax sp. Seq25_V]|uniref:hypothetical protein n=1 Tax=Bacteriovorax sp. Seq25_V TaxID=1201288 RepID=UPI00038A37AA|nr:hypothetical protein [Bacteriovorax sp. Seq25_V]EQC43693.1 hypothetical protein M900_1460 [Bacteriovorax sp. Seq25_V]